MLDLMNELSGKVTLLDEAIRQYAKRGQVYADAERDYRVCLAKKILIERDKGTPVTVIGDICKGDTEIADKRFKRDCAEVMYKSAQEAINSYKLQIRILDAQISREWSGSN